MLISTEIDSVAKQVGEEKAVELVAKAGFDAWDFSLFAMGRYDPASDSIIEGHPLTGPDYAAFAKRLRKIGEDNGIRCNQSHAPFPVSVRKIRDTLKRAIECTAIAGGEICVIHPNNNKSPQENAEMYLELLPFAKEHGVKIATENMWNWDKALDQSAPAACSSPENFLAHIKAVSDPYLVACLDIGHAEMRGVDTSAVEMIHALGPHLQALHLHDNDLWHDCHQIMFSMDIDFAKVARALKEVGYRGVFTLESCSYLSDFEAADTLRGLQNMAASAKKLVRMFEEA